MTNTERAQKAIEFVLDYERKQERIAENVSAAREHSGYDVKSGDRLIEVKGVGESWKTYTWQALYKTERESLRNHPNVWFLYIVKFKDKESDEVVGFYIIPGVDLENKFCIDIESYGIRSISQNTLKDFLREDWK